MGQPGGSNVPSPEREPTRGTETSKYPEEEKSTEIPQVAASERGRAQTEGLLSFGVVGPVWGYPALRNLRAEAVWKDPPQEVKAL